MAEHSEHYPSDPHRVVYIQPRFDGRLDICSCHDQTRLVVCDNDREAASFVRLHDLVVLANSTHNTEEV